MQCHFWCKAFGEFAELVIDNGLEFAIERNFNIVHCTERVNDLLNGYISSHYINRWPPNTDYLQHSPTQITSHHMGSIWFPCNYLQLSIL